MPCCQEHASLIFFEFFDDFGNDCLLGAGEGQPVVEHFFLCLCQMHKIFLLGFGEKLGQANAQRVTDRLQRRDGRNRVSAVNISDGRGRKSGFL